MLDSVQDIRQRLLIAKLPAMPEILVKLIQLCQVEEAGMTELAALLAKDPAMASKVLSVANSSLYPCRNHKPGLMQSLQTLGMNTTKTLLICESVFQVFSGLADTKATDLRGFWRHSLMAAMCARNIAATLSYPHLEEAYLAGLLHDVGRLALLSAAPKEYSLLASHIDDASLCLAEERMFHLSHGEAGALLIERWELDSYLADSVRYHHQPTARAVSAHPLIRTVILADALASCATSQAAANLAQTLCGIDAAALAKICGDATEQVRQTAAMLKIDLAETESVVSLLYPATPVITPADFNQQLAMEVQQLVLNSTAKMFYSQASGIEGVLSAIRESAALLFGFTEVLLLLRDDASNCLHGVATRSCRADHAEFMMPLDDGGAVSVSMSQGRVAFIESDSRLPKLSEEQQLLLHIINGRVKPNAKPESIGQTEFPNRTAGTAYPALSLAEEQLLRLLDAEYLVCLPLLHGAHCRGVLLGAALDLQVSELQSREAFLLAFACQAAAAIDAASRKEDEERRSESQIAAEYRQASRQAVHEASNPLSIIKNYLAVLGNKVVRQESVADEIAILSAEIDRVGQILRELAEIKPAPSDEMVEVDRVVGEAVKFFSASLPPPVRIATQLQAGTTKLKAEADALKQILLNLIKNAVEAIPNYGEIMVSTSAAINRDGRLYCGLTVSDNGPGIAPEVLAKLFSPIATTKAGQHMGLGLSIVHDLVRRLDGAITCRSNGDGTSFEILLPVGDTASGDPAYLRPDE
ncbi:MAG: HDOD domain-containing protein [Proteobacteria bacterium]|nr:HDOD domain-containing protein [Pseudomonadota bacterium]